MSVKIRLQRHGKKGKPLYWIVAADARAKRDGRYLQKLGTYNPNTNPATINLNIMSLLSGYNSVLNLPIQLEIFFLTKEFY